MICIIKSSSSVVENEELRFSEEPYTEYGKIPSSYVKKSIKLVGFKQQ